MLSKTIENAINTHITAEFSSAHAYLAVSAYFEAQSLPGFARWMRLQSQEEYSHAMKLFDYLNNRGGRVMLQTVSQPTNDFTSPLAAFEQALESERKVTTAINEIYALALKENDYPTQIMLQWFIEEQVEEEKTAEEIVTTLKRVGDHWNSIIMLDRQLGSRTA